MFNTTRELIHKYWTRRRQIHRVCMDKYTHACVGVRAESRGKQKPPHIRANKISGMCTTTARCPGQGVVDPVHTG